MLSFDDWLNDVQKRTPVARRLLRQYTSEALAQRIRDERAELFSWTLAEIRDLPEVQR